MALFGIGKKKKAEEKPKLPTLNEAVIHDSKQGASQMQGNNAMQQPAAQQPVMQQNAQNTPNQQNSQSYFPQGDADSQSPLQPNVSSEDEIPTQDEASFEEQFNTLLQDSPDDNEQSHPLDSSGASNNTTTNTATNAQNNAAQSQDSSAQQMMQTDNEKLAQVENEDLKKEKKSGFFNEFNELPDVMEAPQNKSINVKVRGDVDINGSQYEKPDMQPNFSDLEQKKEPAPPKPKPAAPPEKRSPPKFIKKMIHGKPELFVELRDLRTVYDDFSKLDNTSGSISQTLHALERMHDVEEATMSHFKNYFEELQQDLKNIDHLLFEDFEGE